MISGIIKVEVSVISRSRRLRLITLTETLIIPDITKTESNNCLICRLRAQCMISKSNVKFTDSNVKIAAIMRLSLFSSKQCIIITQCIVLKKMHYQRST